MSERIDICAEKTPNKGSDGGLENVNNLKKGNANLFIATLAIKTITF